jgi:hypothetical protein
VAATTGVYGAAAPASGGARYQVGGEDDWSTDDGNAPTEEIPELPPAYVNPYAQPMGQSPMSGPYGSMGYASGLGAPALDTPTGTSRTMRIVVGILCLLGSVISAAAAIILALAQSPATGR